MTDFTASVPATPSRNHWLAALLVASGIVLGGGGSAAPLPEMLLQCTAALIAAALMLSPGGPAALARADRRAWIVAALIVVLPLVQLVPLPPALWQRLPGRELEAASLALVGASGRWMPWSLSPSRTFASLLVMLPTAALVPLVASLGGRGRALVVTTIAVMAVLALIVGTGQISGGGTVGGGGGNSLRFYVPEARFLNGFQANHNSSADMLMIGMVALVAALREWLESPGSGPNGARRRQVSPALALSAAGFTALLFSLAVFLSGSRAGMVLLPVPLLAVAVIAWPWLRTIGFPGRRIGARDMAMALVAALFAGLLAAWLLRGNGAVARIAARYDFAGEGRPEIWRDALYAMQQYFPFGSGMGTFAPVFDAAERLEAVAWSRTGRAHNDVLELAIEGGAFGLALMSVIAAMLANAARRAWNSGHHASRPQILFALAALAVIALHSQVDYPLRSMALGFVGAACAGLLMPLPWGRNRVSKHA